MLKCEDELIKLPLFFLKFSNNLQRLESLQNGNLYMNTVKYFKELEEKTKEKGMGDKDEGAMVLTDLDLKFYNHETEELIFEGQSSRSTITTEEDLQKHIFCMYFLDFGCLEIIEEKENSVVALLKFTDKQKEELIKDFGKHVIAISYPDFINNIRKSFKEDNIEWVGDKVKYSDFSINLTDRLEDFANGRDGRYFWKDKYFENQKEYRIIVLNRDSDDPIQLNIGNLSGSSFITSTEELFNDKFCLEIRVNNKKDIIKIEE